MTKNLFIRNILNGLFILIALVAMIGILVAKNHLMVWYAIGLFAVLIKMVEVMLRMPGMRKLRTYYKVLFKFVILKILRNTL